MHYVYLLRSEKYPRETYVGFTQNLKKRLQEHNSGKSSHTKKFAPWNLIAYVAFRDRERVEEFERYLKTGSGRAFAVRHLLDHQNQCR